MKRYFEQATLEHAQFVELMAAVRADIDATERLAPQRQAQMSPDAAQELSDAIVELNRLYDELQGFIGESLTELQAIGNGLNENTVVASRDAMVTWVKSLQRLSQAASLVQARARS